MTVVKTTTPEMKFRRGGKIVTYPEFSTLTYYVGGTEIACTDKDGVLRLNTKYIRSKSSADFKLPYSERIVGSKFEEQYKKLMAGYNKVSEYMNV